MLSQTVAKVVRSSVNIARKAKSRLLIVSDEPNHLQTLQSELGLGGVELPGADPIVGGRSHRGRSQHQGAHHEHRRKRGLSHDTISSVSAVQWLVQLGSGNATRNEPWLS